LTRRLAVLGGSVGLTLVVLVAWIVVDRSSDGPPTSPPPDAGAQIVMAEGSTTSPDPDWVAQTAADLLIPRRAMQAYVAAELLAAQALPDCHVRWNTIAAIGSVESAHGTLGGAGLTEAGLPDKPIIGPALDGTNGTRPIAATEESTQLHGDTEWDHAVGPFQFLTSSWQIYGVDADGDGEDDPFDIDDAALAAANHLCDDERDLATDDWGTAVFAYNNSTAYVAQVKSIANSFAP